MEIETAATSAIKGRIADTDLLSQCINEGDKEPVWDGAIYAYNSKGHNHNNDLLIGRAPVQVKGKLCKNLRNNKTTYPVSINNLKLYRDDGGVIYFVVLIDDANKQKKIYYAALLPFLINQYLNIAKGRKSISINLRALPDNDYDFENIVINFIKDRKKQSNLSNNWTIQKVAELLGPDKIKMKCDYTCIGYDANDPFSYMKDNEMYLYAGNEDGSFSVPVVHLSGIDMMSHEPNVSVDANGNHYYDKVRITRFRDEHLEIKIGKSFSFNCLDSKASLNYKLEGNLDEQLNSMKFLCDVIKDHGFSINNSKFLLSPTEDELKRFDVTETDKRIKYFELVKKLLDKLGVRETLDLEALTSKQEDYLRMLINAIIYGRRAGFKEKGKIPPLVNITISNINLLVLFSQMEDGRYDIKDFFRTQLDCKLDEAGDDDTSQFSILTANEYLKSSNIDVSIIEKDFMLHHNKKHFERTTLCTLEMIKAYDRNNERKDLLKMAERLNSWLALNDGSKDTYKINIFQCKKRYESLDDNDIETIGNLVSKTDDIPIKAAGNILLENKKMSEILMKKMDENQLQIFQDYPIFTLYKKLN